MAVEAWQTMAYALRSHRPPDRLTLANSAELLSRVGGAVHSSGSLIVDAPPKGVEARRWAARHGMAFPTAQQLPMVGGVVDPRAEAQEAIWDLKNQVEEVREQPRMPDGL